MYRIPRSKPSRAAKPVTIEGNSDIPCDCCGRFHRKLYRVESYWLGKNCAESLRLYRKWPQKNSVVWRGWESNYDKVAEMVKT